VRACARHDVRGDARSRRAWYRRGSDPVAVLETRARHAPLVGPSHVHERPPRDDRKEKPVVRHIFFVPFVASVVHVASPLAFPARAVRLERSGDLRSVPVGEPRRDRGLETPGRSERLVRAFEEDFEISDDSVCTYGSTVLVFSRVTNAKPNAKPNPKPKPKPKPRGQLVFRRVPKRLVGLSFSSRGASTPRPYRRNERNRMRGVG